MTSTDDDLSEYRDAFSLFDKKGDNKVELTQVGDIIRALGLNPTEAELKRILQTFPSSDDEVRRVSFDEFWPVFTSLQKKKVEGSFEDFTEGLRVFDKDGSGTINSAELRHVLCTLGERLTEDEVDMLIQGLEDSQGQVNYEEFVKTVLEG
ncbi:Myosin light polypeptide 6 [Holothuria leucospilota]|uniref:Myosin light polypeptide 6 n=1 Tax=Holothuria leucospilota TaxID=206669 RepID=A0A9Q1C022_HOLLE|nr:Myosin light polypeptide 6 [Holothuria leucospilota]